MGSNPARSINFLGFFPSPTSSMGLEMPFEVTAGGQPLDPHGPMSYNDGGSQSLGGASVWGWIKNINNSEFVNKMAEKAKVS